MSTTMRVLELPGVLLLAPEIHPDGRGHFFEAWNAADFAEATGCRQSFVQDNHSRSRAGVIRGLHYQLPNPQGKLVRVTTGTAWICTRFPRSRGLHRRAVQGDRILRPRLRSSLAMGRPDYRDRLATRAATTSAFRSRSVSTDAD